MACLSVLVGIALLSIMLLTGYGGLAVLFWRRNTRHVAWAVTLSGAVVSVVCLLITLPGSEVAYHLSIPGLIKTVAWSALVGFGIGAALATFIALPILLLRSKVSTFRRKPGSQPPPQSGPVGE